MFYFLTSILILLLVVYVTVSIRRPPNYPPGPPWLPLLGNLLELKKLSIQFGGQHKALWELAKNYNTNVLGLKLGKDHVVTVFSYPVVKRVLTGEEYEGRPNSFFMKLRCMGSRKGITSTDGDLWKTQRHFVTTHLRKLGYGKNLMEEMIQNELVEVLEILEGNKNSVRIGKILAPAVINILWTLTTGSRIDRKDLRLKKLLDLFRARSKAFDLCGGTLSQHPWLRFVAPERTGYNLIRSLNRELKDLLLETINEHYKTPLENDDSDLIYEFIKNMESGGKNSTFTEDQLIMVCLDIFIAGSHTTSNTLDFAFIMMILHPDIQKRVQECLDSHFDKYQMIQYNERNKVPYVEAVLLEVIRCFAVAPICGPRRVLRDTILEGYYIPKETTVLISLHSVLNDKEYWKDPEVFRPERFLDSDGNLLPQDRVITFGLGKRRCLGETLARTCIFLFFTAILMKYNIVVSPGTKTPTGIPIPGITLTPEYYEASFVKRKKDNL